MGPGAPVGVERGVPGCARGAQRAGSGEQTERSSVSRRVLFKEGKAESCRNLATLLSARRSGFAGGE